MESEEIVVLESVNPYSALKRRQAGKREWKVSIEEVLKSEREGMKVLRELSDKYSTDAATQKLIGEGFEQAAGRVIALTELLHYKDTGEAINGTENGGQQ